MGKNIFGILKIVFIALGIGILNEVIAAHFVFPQNKMDEEIINTFVSFMFGAWILPTTFLLYESIMEWKSTKESIYRNNQEEFLILVKHRIPIVIWILDMAISIAAVFSFYLFYISSVIAFITIHISVGFVVALTILILFEIDNPIKGLINIEGIPSEWRKEVMSRK